MPHINHEQYMNADHFLTNNTSTNDFRSHDNEGDATTRPLVKRHVLQEYSPVTFTGSNSFVEGNVELLIIYNGMQPDSEQYLNVEHIIPALKEKETRTRYIRENLITTYRQPASIIISRARNLIIESLTNRLLKSNFPKLAERIQYLFSESQIEDDEYQKDLNVESLQAFIDFYLQNTQFKEPSIVLTPEGYIRALWKESAKKFFRLEFVPNLDVRFVLFNPIDELPGKIERMAGSSIAGRVVSRLEEYDIHTWAYNV